MKSLLLLCYIKLLLFIKKELKTEFKLLIIRIITIIIYIFVNCKMNNDKLLFLFIERKMIEWMDLRLCLYYVVI
jgi:hypothetical protein